MFGPVYAAFREAFRDFGYVEGQNVWIEYRYAEADPDRLVKLATELVAQNPDVIVAIGPDSLRALNRWTVKIPLVGVDYEADPISAKYIESFARPGRNITGVFLDQPELSGKWLQLLREAIPRLQRAAVLKDVTAPNDQLNALKSAATSMAITLNTLLIQSVDDFENAFVRASKQQAQALVILSSPLIGRQGPRLAALAGATRLPTISFFAEHARTGALMSYGPSQIEVFHRLGSLAARILKGTHPAELPSERPTKFELVINAKTAKAVGLTIPPSLLLRADQVIDP